MCVQEEKRLIMEQDEKVYLTAQGKKKGDQAKNKGKIPTQSVIKKESKCFFRKKKRHIKKEDSKFKNWLNKKGTSFTFICYESNCGTML